VVFLTLSTKKIAKLSREATIVETVAFASGKVAATVACERRRQSV
jgi:hypothetical protein